ncbi:trypsin-like serine protease [Micromonospora sp. NPDC004704]
MRVRMRPAMARALVLGLLASGVVLALPGVASADTEVTEDAAATDTAVAVFTADLGDGLTELSARDAAALETAEARAEADPTDLAPPYYDALTGRVAAPVLTTASPTKVAYAAGSIAVPSVDPDEQGVDESVPGESSVKETDAVAPLSAPRAADVPAFPVLYYPATPRVTYSLAQLAAARDEVLSAGLAGSEHMYSAYIDAPGNRVVVEASGVTQGMRLALAVRYGTRMVALRLTPGENAGEIQARHNDTSPFYGGARMGPDGCTIGFSWTHEGQRYFITAGHCTSLNQNVYMNGYSSAVGKVIDDNWANASGSTKINGASYYSGDLSLVKMNSGYSTFPRVYTGGPTSSTSRVVGGISSRAPKTGDHYCTGGSTKGTICNWKVTSVNVTVKYSDGTVARNMTKGTKHGHCTAPGDSGGPIFTINSAGKIIAKGIHSGGGGGGSDHYTGALESPCREYFTDIRLAEKILPGIIKRY